MIGLRFRGCKENLIIIQEGWKAILKK